MIGTGQSLAHRHGESRLEPQGGDHPRLGGQVIHLWCNGETRQTLEKRVVLQQGMNLVRLDVEAIDLVLDHHLAGCFINDARNTRTNHLGQLYLLARRSHLEVGRQAGTHSAHQPISLCLIGQSPRQRTDSAINRTVFEYIGLSLVVYQILQVEPGHISRIEEHLIN